MTFLDPQSLPEPLLWLRADRGVGGGTAAHWDGVTNTQLRGEIYRGLETGDADFAFTCWVRVNALPAAAGPDAADTHIAGKWTSSYDPAREWLLFLDSPTGADQFALAVRDADSRTKLGPRSALPGGLRPGRWYFVAVWHDTARKTLNLSVDGVSSEPVPFAGGMPGAHAIFHLGAAVDVAGHPSISLSRAAFFKNTPGGIGGQVAEIVATLHAGADLADLPPGTASRWGMMAYWPLDELTGPRRNHLPASGLDLRDYTAIGSAPGPFVRPAADGRPVTRWDDQVGDRAFDAGPGSRAVWLGDQQRLLAASPGDRLGRDGLALSGRPRWTATVVASTRLQRGFGLYGESSGPADDDYLEIRVDHRGVPELAVRPAVGLEVVARADEALAGRRAVTGTATAPAIDNGDGVPRVECHLAVGDGHPFATGDLILVKGLGPPFDGEHRLTHATELEVHYVVDRPGAAPETAGARRIRAGDMAESPTRTGRLDHSLDCRLAAPWSGDSWTVAGWVRKADVAMDGRPGGAGIFAAKAAWDVEGRPARPQVVHGGDGTPGSYRLELPGGPSAAFGPAPRDSWVHLAAVRSGASIALYYDGAPAGALDVSADPSLGSTFTGLGFGFDAELTAALPCDVDGWGVWLGRSLSGAEVAALRGAGAAFDGLPAGLRAGLAAWYDFDEVSGDARDASGNGRHLVERGLIPSAEGVGGGIPFAPAPAGGLVVGTGRSHIAGGLSSDAGPGEEYRRFVLTVRRDGGTVSFFRDGLPIGSSAIDPTLLGPGSGRSFVLGSPRRLGAPHGSLEQVLAVGEALDDEEVAALGARLSVRVNRDRGVGPLAVLFDATQLGGIDRMAAQDYHYLWAFTRAGEVAPHDDSTSPWSGHAYARSTGFFVSQVFREEGRYDAHLAVISPPYDRRGRPQPQSCLFAGKVATVTVDPWPDSTVTYFVSSEHPSRDDEGPGTSPDAPLATVGQAMGRLDRPYTRILLRRGEQFPFSHLSFHDKIGPILLGAYGDPDDGRPALIPSTRDQDPSPQSFDITGSFDLRVVGVALHDTGDMDPQSPRYAKLAFVSGGRARLLLIHDVSAVDTHRFYYPHNSDRACVIDRNDLRSLGDYTIITEGAHELSVTRNALDGAPGLHTYRFHNSHRTQVAFSHRDAPYASGAGQSWCSLRHESCYSVVTDNTGGLFYYPTEPKPYWLAAQLALSERNRLRNLTGGGDRITARDNTVGEGIFFYDSGSPRSSRSEGTRVYDNQLPPGSHATRGSEVPYLVEDQNPRLGAAPATAPAIGLAVAGPGAAILAAEGPGAGPSPWRLRWMRRRADLGGSFEPMAGQAASAILDLPPSPGAFEYRLDLVTHDGEEALGLEPVTLVVPAAGAGAGYLLTPPDPSSGLVGAPSGPFTLALQGDPPASPVAFTPSCDGRGRFEPARLALSAEAPSATFRFIPAAGIGTYVIAVTNDGGLTDPAPASYVATVPIGTPEDVTPVSPPPPQPWPLDPSPVAEGRGESHRGPRGQGHRGPVLPTSRGPSLAAPPAPTGGADGMSPEDTGRHRYPPGVRSLAAPPSPGRPGGSPSSWGSGRKS